MRGLGCLFLMICSFKPNWATLKECAENHDQLELCLTSKDGYSKPFPVVVSTILDLKEIIEININKKSIKVQADLWAYWKDEGIALSNGSLKTSLELTEEAANTVWSPDIKFGHLLMLEKMEGIGGRRTSKSSNYFFASETNSLVYGVPMQLTFSCHFDFSGFPFDSNECPMELGERFGQTKDVLYNASQIIHDNESHIIGDQPIILDNLALPYKFHLQSLPVIQKSNSHGNTYSYTGMLMKIQRKSVGQLLSGYYYPTASFALLSMISFLIKADKVPGRMGMILMLYLISTNVYSSVNAPHDRGFSYIEVWTLGSQVPILLAFCEYGYILYLKKIETKVGEQNQAMNPSDPKPTLDDMIKKMDFATMIISFIFYVTFASLYWIISFL